MLERRSTLVVLGLLVLAPALADAGKGFPAHYLVFSIDRTGAIEPQFHRLVSLAEPPRSQSDESMAAIQREVPREEESVIVRVLDAGGKIVFQEVARVPRWIRGEFHDQARKDGTWTIEGHRFEPEERSFVVRVPVIEGTRLTLELPARPGLAGGPASFDLDALAASSTRLPLAGTEAPQTVSGSPGNRVDLLILGDGYTSAEQSKFSTDAGNLENSFFGIPPYGVYKNYVNMVSLFTASAQSGTDHPPYNPVCAGDNPACCADSAANSDPKAGTYVNTALDARYCAFNVHRFVVVSESKAMAAASAYPDWDRILVLVNDSTYGGSGGSVPVASTNTFSVDIARHEYGHSFTGLADEYDSAYPGYPPCTDASGSETPCEANVTDETSRDLIKWNPWISPSTPVPTPEGNALYGDETGLFLGARYSTSGMYRHEDTHCLMLILGQPFGEVCGEAYVLKLYRGTWGSPWEGIDPIEPGLESPPPGTVQTVTGAHLSAPLLSPVGGPPLQVVWTVDGAAVPGAQGSSFDFFVTGAGTYQVRIEVQDTTALVQPAMAGTDLQSFREWTVVASGPSETDFYTLTPCRVLDTREPDGPYGGPALAADSYRTFALTGRCGIPATARAVVVNVTAVTPTQPGSLNLYPADNPEPDTGVVSFVPGLNRANNAVVMLAQDGSGTIAIHASSGGSLHAIVDVSGYYE